MQYCFLVNSFLILFTLSQTISSIKTKTILIHNTCCFFYSRSTNTPINISTNSEPAALKNGTSVYQSPEVLLIKYLLEFLHLVPYIFQVLFKNDTISSNSAFASSIAARKSQDWCRIVCMLTMRIEIIYVILHFQMSYLFVHNGVTKT